MSVEKQRRMAFCCLITTFCLWGSLYVVSKYVLGKLPPFTISFVRFVIAFLVLTLIRKKDVAPVEKQDIPFLFLLGIGGYFVAVGTQLLGTKYAGASMVALLNSLNPITMTIFAAVFLHEKLTVRKGLGLLTALMGVFVILNGSSGGNTKGILITLFSVVCWSFVSVWMRRVTQKYDSLQITWYGTGIAAVCYLPVCLWELSHGEAVQPDISCLFALVYMGAFCSGIGYYLWNKSLSVLEAGTCSAFYPVQPLVTTTLGICLLHEVIGPSFWIGAVLIVGGIFINLSGGS